MKNILVLLLLINITLSCNNNDDQEIENQTNKVVLLQVDFLTYVFEGGKELEFSPSTNFTISSTYVSPGDFGSIQLYYEELNEKIFDGTIIWAGTGAITFPTEINLANTFPTINVDLPQPEIDSFEIVMYDDNAYYPDPIEYSKIWNSINNLEVVSNYLNTNPNGKINIFLYTPSVGLGNPADWDWFIILKN